jgi:hypothetical protein
LSARLLRRFRFAVDEARAVEYHHERADGGGYYGLDIRYIPMAAHFLIVADSFDAMTSDRPYRRGLGIAAALAEIERGSGTQFHPLVAKAFIAQQRGLRAGDALTAAEWAQLRRIWPRRRLSVDVRTATVLPVLCVASLVGGLGAVAAGSVPAAAAFGAVAAAVALAIGVERSRARALTESLRRALTADSSEASPLDAFVQRLAEVADVRWAGLVALDALGSTSVEREWGGPKRPTETALVSWLTREAEAAQSLLLTDGVEIGRPGTFASLRIPRRGSASEYLVVNLARALPYAVDRALRECAPQLASAREREDVARIHRLPTVTAAAG